MASRSIARTNSVKSCCTSGDFLGRTKASAMQPNVEVEAKGTLIAVVMQSQLEVAADAKSETITIKHK